MPTIDEHIIRCSECGRDLIVKDTVNNGVAFLSHLKLDHGITYLPQRRSMTKAKVELTLDKNYKRILFNFQNVSGPDRSIYSSGE